MRELRELTVATEQHSHFASAIALSICNRAATTATEGKYSEKTLTYCTFNKKKLKKKKLKKIKKKK